MSSATLYRRCCNQACQIAASPCCVNHHILIWVNCHPFARDFRHRLILYRVTYTSQEPALPVRLQDLYGFDSLKVGLVFLAAVVPTIFCKFSRYVPSETPNVSFSSPSGTIDWLARRYQGHRVDFNALHRLCFAMLDCHLGSPAGWNVYHRFCD